MMNSTTMIPCRHVWKRDIDIITAYRKLTVLLLRKIGRVEDQAGQPSQILNQITPNDV